MTYLNLVYSQNLDFWRQSSFWIFFGMVRIHRNLSSYIMGSARFHLQNYSEKFGMNLDPVDFFPWLTIRNQQNLGQRPQVQIPDPPNRHPPPQNNPHNENPPRSNHQKPKKNHNLAVQLAITIKQMMRGRIQQIGSSQGRQNIIREVWRIFTRDTRRTKQILMVMFNERIYNQTLIQKYGFKEIYENSHFIEYQQAMTELRREIFHVMDQAAVQSHITNRNKISQQNKPRVIAYINGFISNELRMGLITSRQDERTAMIIEEILNRTSRDELFLSSVIASYHEEIGDRLGNNVQP